MRNLHVAAAIAALAALPTLAGCGAARAVAPAQAGNVLPTPPQRPEIVIDRELAAALDAFVAHDRANAGRGDWSAATCASVARAFEDVAVGKVRALALYDAGLAYQRCDDDHEAELRFKAAADADPKMSVARSEVALYAFKRDGDVHAAVAMLERAVSDSKFQDVSALVSLARFQMMRDSSRVGETCHAEKGGEAVELGDFECAHLNLQRALAIDDAYMPALNQLALYHLGLAKKHAAANARKADVQELEMAALVCAQAMRRSDAYAPIHNTAGLVFVALDQPTGAAREFEKATLIMPRMFEAQMNLAAVNLSFRGFARSEAAYRRAIEIHPNDYGAHLGLALAIRGSLDAAHEAGARVAEIRAELARCKALDASRPEAFFNEAILVEEFIAPRLEKKPQIDTYREAQDELRVFIKKASGAGAFVSEVKNARDRIADIEKTIDFLKGP